MNKKSIQNTAWGLLYALWTGGTFIFVSLVLVGLPLGLFASEKVYAWFETSVGSLVLAAVIYVLATVLVLLPFIVRRKPWKLIFEKLGVLKRLNLRTAGSAVFVWVMYFFSTAVATEILYLIKIPGLDLTQQQSLGFEQLSGVFAYIAAFVLLVIVAPVFEELLFRGYLFGVVHARNSFWVSAVITSLTFAFMHGQLNVGIDVFILSLFLCYLREKTQSLWPGVLVHALKNGLAYTILFLLPLFGMRLV